MTKKKERVGWVDKNWIEDFSFIYWVAFMFHFNFKRTHLSQIPVKITIEGKKVTIEEMTQK